MQTTNQYTDHDEPYPWDRPDPTIISQGLVSALQQAQRLADRLAADTTEPIIAQAYGSVYERLQTLQTEAEVIHRITRCR